MIPQKKILEAIETINKIDCSLLEKSQFMSAIYKYAEFNIPVDYWLKDMHNFKGPKPLVRIYEQFASNLEEAYSKGTGICLAGSHGTGKTLTSTCILKRAAESKKYSGLYVNLTDIVNILTSSNKENRDEGRRLLLTSDFLVIDEFDQRFIGASENAAELFGRLLESTIRSRIHNKLPIILCTNNPKPVDGFTGALKISIDSLMKLVKIIPVIDKDHRGA